VRPDVDGLVVLCAANNYDGVKVADHHFAERLARIAPVLYVDPPLSRLTPRNDPGVAPSLAGPRLRRVAAGFWRLTPVVAPFPTRPGMRAVTAWLVRRAMARAVRSIGMEVRAVVTAWPELDVFEACGERLRVWWAQDDFAAGAGLMGLVPERLAAGERARAASSGLVVAANPDVARRWQREGHDVELIPYGCDAGSFAQVEDVSPAPGVQLAPPVAALVGQLNERVDPALLEELADRGVSLLLVGPAAPAVADWLAALTARPNVTWVGAQPFTALPGFLAHAHVGLVPYADTAFNRGSFPLKTLEYLAAGLPVVATDLPATRWLGGAPDLYIASGPASYADAVVRAATLPLTGKAREARRSFARSHSYDNRAIDLLGAIERRDEASVPEGVRTFTLREPSAVQTRQEAHTR
jgi:teichuronic acid biosynthesis glycosyltransferase TuaH